MTSSMIPDEARLHRYVDGQLDPVERQEVESFLARSPDWAARVAGWKRDAESLRCGAPRLPHNPALEPAAIRRRLRARGRQRLAVAAMLLLTAGLGGTAGWTMRDRSFAAANPPMADAVQAYRVFAASRSNAVEVSTTAGDGMQSWLASNLGRGGVALPDLSGFGLRLVGGRLLATEDGPAAMVLFEDGQARRVAYYVRPGAPFDTDAMAERRDGGLLARYWSHGGRRYAVVAPADDAQAAEIARILRATS
ncbi:anti-sigma factor family protein [Roseomonas elaeocarpi]|uniref:Anti-sigma factor family protein n=1 Tax=Roseomonas elaeocarpi TaxID=907779 RepID=A0ABV6JRE8_9PROT